MNDSRPSVDDKPSVEDEPSVDDEHTTVINPEASDITKEYVQHDSSDQPVLMGSDVQPVNGMTDDKSAGVPEELDNEAEHHTSGSVEYDSLEPATTDDAEPDSYKDPDEEPQARLTSSNLGLVGALEVTMTLNVGSKRMAITDILNLHTGSVVCLNRREHDPLDVMINGVLFARGEVVRTGDYYGLRILEIL
ncbi:FliM/FliN family flagellar motor switch protein [Endozoicomonas acroporae]|uniref:FliM/FliN family flagellar motor switch protein n=1 Tax=Endozoicomonas acroporae TaxID=1701104 RepID=UPI000C76A33B|nr:FliM/FliN family flagellar motor switch protein [Endozoicomonas acroporae]